VQPGRKRLKGNKLSDLSVATKFECNHLPLHGVNRSNPSRVNHTKPLGANGRPYGDDRCLCDTEQVVRSGRSILKDLKLPAWEGGAAWPPHRPCWGLQLAASMARIPAPPMTLDQIAARDTAQRRKANTS
jgi:hypothetical protein